MIQKFNQFINENQHQDNISVYNAISEPYGNFIERIEDRINTFTERITYMTKKMDHAIESLLVEFNDVIVGEPIITVESDLSEIKVELHTNIPNNDEAWETDESPAQNLEHELYLTKVDDGVNVTIDSNPNEDGNCVIVIQRYIVDSENFGDYTDTLMQLGEDW